MFSISVKKYYSLELNPRSGVTGNGMIQEYRMEIWQ